MIKRRIVMLCLIVFAALGVSLVLLPAVQAQGPSRTSSVIIVDLGTLVGYPRCEPWGLNNRGEVVGTCYADVYPWLTQAFIYTGTLGLQPPAGFGGLNSESWAINDAGQMVGTSFVGGYRSAIVWQQGVTTTMGHFSGGSSSEGFGINSQGVVVGRASEGDGFARASLWRSGTLRNLGLFPGTPATVHYSTAFAINQGGTVVGSSTVPQHENVHAFRWYTVTEGLVDLGTFGGSTSEARAINDTGQIVGYASYSGGLGYNPYLAALWEAGSITATRLALFPGHSETLAFDINNAGLIVGVARNGPRQEERAVLWNQWRQAVDLNDLLPPDSAWVLTQALAINDVGQVSGVGTYQGQPRPFLLTLPPDFGIVRRAFLPLIVRGQ